MAHAIKGMTANLGMDRLSEASAELMQLMRQGEVPAGVVEKYREALAGTKAEAEMLMAAL